jgi:AcrR family transcriptional regulator
MVTPTTRTKTPSARALQAEKTRELILETAQRLFAEHGYDATSLQVIADELGLTKAAVYYHFRAKADILHAAMQPGVDQIAALLDQTATIRGRRARIDTLVNGYVDFLVTNRHYAVMASTDPAMKRHKSDAEFSKLHDRGRTLLFGDDPTGAERVAYDLVFGIPDCLPSLIDLSDDKLRDALLTTLLRILRG